MDDFYEDIYNMEPNDQRLRRFLANIQFIMVSPEDSLLQRAQMHFKSRKYRESIEDYKAALEVNEKPDIRDKLNNVHKCFEKENPLMYHSYILRINEHSSYAEAKKSYRTLSLTYHPDKHQLKGKAEVQKNEEEFKRINNAHKFFQERKESK